MKAITAIDAAILLTLSILPPKDLIIKYPTYVKKRIKVVVSRGSHIQGLPQIGVAQIGPVIKTKAINIVPISADANPRESQTSFFVNKKVIPDNIAKK